MTNDDVVVFYYPEMGVLCRGEDDVQLGEFLVFEFHDLYLSMLVWMHPFIVFFVFLGKAGLAKIAVLVIVVNICDLTFTAFTHLNFLDVIFF